jgi:hypothetical protein
MGRTLSTANQIILDEQKAYADFRRGLRRSNQAAFDELFANARKHTAAITMASHALPFETILLAMLLEEHLLVQRLGQEIDELRNQMNGCLPSNDE